jgi:hypothetical protein
MDVPLCSQLAFSMLRDKVHALGMAIGDVISRLIDETLGAVMKILRISSIFELKNNELLTS